MGAQVPYPLTVSRVAHRLIGGLAVTLILLCAPAIGATDDPAARLASTLPRAATDCTEDRAREVAAAADTLEQWAAERTWKVDPDTPEKLVAAIADLVRAKRAVDSGLDSVIELRTSFVEQVEGPARREMLRQYLRITSQLVDLSGRLRYLLYDAIDNATYELSPYPEQVDRLIELLHKNRMGIGAEVMSYVLFDPAPESGFEPFSLDVKRRVLELFAAVRQIDLIEPLSRFVRQQDAPAQLVVRAAEIIRQIGLPQDPRPGKPHPVNPRKPLITAKELRTILAEINASDLDDGLTARHDELLSWLDARIKRGIVGDELPVGRFSVRAGDWLLMRNPSPYNCFTDISPGLFTHVGIVTVEENENGFRRFVVVDLLERGQHVPAINVEAYLRETLNYFFVRHKDEAVGRKMAEVANSLIGNEFHFDLNFRTDRVTALKGQPLNGRMINTYCAGILILCAQETDLPHEEFFPIPENRAGGHCPENLAKMGLSIGDHFVSPTGPLFSPNLRIVGRREPMYSPAREVKEAVYDYFAESMVERRLTLSPNATQALREKLASLSKYNPWLASMLAKANDVSEHMDLEAAAKAAAVVETLDEIAQRFADEFFDARQAVRARPPEELATSGATPEQIERLRMYRNRHRELLERWTAGDLTPRQLRIALVEHYKKAGQRELDDRFFRSTTDGQQD